jgi:translation elongation factor EF-1beta
MPIQEITLATMIDIKSPVDIPNFWIKRLTDSDKYAVLLKSHPSMFRIVTTKEPIVTEFYLDLTTLEEDFLELIFKKIEHHKLKPLYSSGVCFYDDTCYYLFIVDGDRTEISDNVTETLKEIQGVKNVTIKTYSLDKT